MRNGFTCQTVLRAVCCVLVTTTRPALVKAQAPAASGPVATIDAGYSYVSEERVGGGSRVGLNGGLAGLTVSLGSRFSIRGELAYLRAGNVGGSGHSGDIFSYLTGPVVELTQRRRLQIAAQGLFGAARVTGATLGTGGGFILGYANEPAWTVGAVGEYALTAGLGLRAEAGWLHTSFFNANSHLAGQQNFRTSLGIVWRFGSRSEGYRLARPAH